MQSAHCPRAWHDSLHEHFGGHATADTSVLRLAQSGGLLCMPSMQCCEAHRCAPAHMPQAGPLVGHKKFLSREGAAFCRGRNGREPENTRWPCLHLQVVKTLAMQHAWSLWLEVAGSVLTCGSQRAAPGPTGLGNRPWTCREAVGAERSRRGRAASARNRRRTD